MSVLESSDRAEAQGLGEFVRWPGLLSLSLGVLLGPLVALINQEAIYAGDMWACGHNAGPVLHIIPVLCLIVTGGAGIGAYLNWRRVGRGVEVEHGAVATRTRFLSILGMGVSAISALVILAQWFSIVMFGPCMRA